MAKKVNHDVQPKRKRALKQVSRADLRGRELLRIAEAAGVLGESRANVYLRIQRREIVGIKFGKTIRVHGPSLFALIDKLVAGTQAPPAAA
jgi:predicted DNA-binding transcriptional regulator AlpA